jgi:ABC-2 type transport system permease protein
MLPVLIPVTALILGSGALGNEIEDRTLVYLTLRPVSRITIVFAKYVATLIVVAGLVELAVCAMFVIASRKTVPVTLISGVGYGGFDTGNALVGTLVAAFAGTAAYVALFLLLGVLMPHRGLLVGFAYVLGWEGAAAGLSGALATLSVRRYAQGTLDAWLNDTLLARIGPATVGAIGSAVALSLIVVASIILCVMRLRRLELT